MNLKRILFSLCLLPCLYALAAPQDINSSDSYIEIKPTSDRTRIGQLLEDSTSRRTEFERSLTRRVLDNTRIISLSGDKKNISGNDSVRELILTFYENQFRHSQDPMTPYFMLMSKDATMAMGVGGVIRMRGWYDFNGSIEANGFSPYLIPVPRNPDLTRGLGCTPAGTAIYFSILGRHTPLGNFMGYIEANFNGFQNTDFHLKKAFFTINDFTVGYDTSTFCLVLK